MNQIKSLPGFLPTGRKCEGERRTACVIVSDMPIGSPIVSKPNVLIAMNLPSFEKYDGEVVSSGGKLFADSSLYR